MVLLLCIVCFVINFLCIQCEYNITVKVNKLNENCIVENVYEVPVNETIKIYYENNLTFYHENNPGPSNINSILYSDKDVDLINNKDETVEADLKQDNLPGSKENLVTKNGVIKSSFTPAKNSTKYKFLFLYLIETNKDTTLYTRKYIHNGTSYNGGSDCATEIRLVDRTDNPDAKPFTALPDPTNSTGPPAANSTSTWKYVTGGLAVVAIVTIAGQTAGIMYFKAKAARLDQGRPGVKKLPEHSNNVEDDSTRYSTMPGLRGLKIPSLGKKREQEDQERESKIYETVNIPMTDMSPPDPPALSSLPRLPRNRPTETQTHLAAPTPSLGGRGRAPHASPMTQTMDRGLPRPIPATPVSQRLPMPLPTQEEHYEDVTFDLDETYEPPPINDTQHPRTPVVKSVRNPLPVPPKPYHRADPDAPSTAVKPKLAPKTKIPPPIPNPVTSELDNILKKRRNVIQVPVQSIPEQSTTPFKTPMTKPKPPPLVKKPVMPKPPMEEPARVDDDHFDSSDEEWTYEPLKPIDTHIYNI